MATWRPRRRHQFFSISWKKKPLNARRSPFDQDHATSLPMECWWLALKSPSFDSFQFEWIKSVKVTDWRSLRLKINIFVVFDWISFILIPLDSPLNGLSNIFWVRSDRSRCLSANWRQKGPTRSVGSLNPRDRPPSFADNSATSSTNSKQLKPIR